MQLSIGELSARTDVKVPTIRYYEQIGLMPAPLRTSGQQRRYGAAELSRLTFIRHARDLGFEVEDIRELLELNAHPEFPCDEADSIAARHLAAVERRIAQLRALQDELRRMITECKGGNRIANCRVIEVLTDHSLCSNPEH